jgi:predicted outer membrane protein
MSDASIDRATRLCAATCLAIALAAGACQGERTVSTSLIRQDGAADRAPGPAIVTDGEALGILVDLVAGELAAAQVGARRASGAARAFAVQMVAAEAEANRLLDALGERTGLRPVASAVRTGLAEDLRKRVQALEQHEDAGFDRAFLASQVALHRAMRDLIDDEVRPAARNADLLDQAVKLRAIIAEQLARAQALLGALDRPTDAALEGGTDALGGATGELNGGADR